MFVGSDPGTEVRTHLGRRVGADPELEAPDETEFGGVVEKRFTGTEAIEVSIGGGKAYVAEIEIEAWNDRPVDAKSGLPNHSKHVLSMTMWLARGRRASAATART